VNLNKLRTFIHVVESGSVSQTAQDLFRTQPAISSALKDLEQDVGLCLFERRNAKIFTTPEGRELYQFARQRIRELDDKADRMRADLSELSGTIRLGILHDYSKHLSARVIQGFREKYPKVRFQLYSQSTETLEANMLNGELDYALMVSYQHREQFEISPFMNFQREPMAAPSYLKRMAAITEYEDLLNADHLALGERLGSLRMWLKKNGQKSFDSIIDKIQPFATTTDMPVFNDLVIQGLGVGLCYTELVQTEINRRQLVRLFPDADPIHITLDISRRKVRSSSLLMDTFCAYMQEISPIK